MNTDQIRAEFEEAFLRIVEYAGKFDFLRDEHGTYTVTETAEAYALWLAAAARYGASDEDRRDAERWRVVVRALDNVHEDSLIADHLFNDTTDEFIARVDAAIRAEKERG